MIFTCAERTGVLYVRGIKSFRCLEVSKIFNTFLKGEKLVC